jgi:signal transduction histidine kinase
LAVEIATQHSTVNGDPGRLRQVVWNLISNGVKFTPAGGRVDVLVKDAPQRPETLQIQVRDTGVGIAADVLPRVFEAFEQGGGQVTRRFGGLGLGLAIARALVAAHGGTIDAASEGEGRGSTFTVRLPTSAATISVPSASKNLPSPAPAASIWSAA